MRMEWVASNLALYRKTVYPALLPLIRTPRLPAVDCTDTPADLNGLVRFAERPNLVSARVPSRFERALTMDGLFRVRMKPAWLPTPFASFPFHFSSRASPCATRFRFHSNTGWTVPSQNEVCLATHSIRLFPLSLLLPCVAVCHQIPFPL